MEEREWVIECVCVCWIVGVQDSQLIHPTAAHWLFYLFAGMQPDSLLISTYNGMFPFACWISWMQGWMWGRWRAAVITVSDLAAIWALKQQRLLWQDNKWGLWHFKYGILLKWWVRYVYMWAECFMWTNLWELLLWIFLCLLGSGLLTLM